MNATMVESGTKAVPPVVSSIQDIPLAKIRESKTNPRRAFDDAKLAELAENIRQHGVLQTILRASASRRVSRARWLLAKLAIGPFYVETQLTERRSDHS